MIKSYQFNYKKVGLFSILALLSLYVLSGELPILLDTDPGYWYPMPFWVVLPWLSAQISLFLIRNFFSKKQKNQ